MGLKKYTFTEKIDTRSGFGVGLAELGDKNPNVVALCADLTGSLKMNAFKDEALTILSFYPESEFKSALVLMVNYVIDRKK